MVFYLHKEGGRARARIHAQSEKQARTDFWRAHRDRAESIIEIQEEKK